MKRTRPDRIPDTPARRAIIKDCLIFFSMYKKEMPYWSTIKLLTYTRPEYREYLTKLVESENKKEND